MKRCRWRRRLRDETSEIRKTWQDTVYSEIDDSVDDAGANRKNGEWPRYRYSGVVELEVYATKAELDAQNIRTFVIDGYESRSRS